MITTQRDINQIDKSVIFFFFSFGIILIWTAHREKKISPCKVGCLPVRAPVLVIWGVLEYPLISIHPRPIRTWHASICYGTIYWSNRSVWKLFVFDRTVWKKTKPTNQPTNLPNKQTNKQKISPKTPYKKNLTKI